MKFKQHTLHLLVCSALAGMAATATLPAQAASGTRLSATAQGNVLKVASGDTFQIASTTTLSKLVLGEGAKVTAPDGYSVTLTVNGVGLPQTARTYVGNVVLTVTQNIDVSYTSSGPGTAPEVLHHVLRTGLYVKDGAIVDAKSVSAIVQGGTVTNASADGITIRSQEETFNGVIVEGASTYTLNQPTIHLVGNGGNDFVGFGAAVKAGGTSNLTVNNARIVTQGAIRTAAFVGDSATLNVNNSRLSASNGTLPSDYTFTVATGKLMEVPWVLGLTGNNRATNLVGSATANYSNSRIKAQAWGALSTDDVTSVRLNVTDSQVDVVDSGYGSYAIGDAVNTFTRTRFKVADMALIMANGTASGTFNQCVVDSGRFGVMMHSNSGGVLTIQDSRITSQAATVQVKSSSPTINIRNAQLSAANGLLIQAVVNDDPYMTELGFPAGGSTVVATLSDSTLSGDIVNGNTASGTVSVTLSNTKLTGAITEATTTHATAADGTALSFSHPELYYLVGEFIHTYASTGMGMSVALSSGSTWVVNQSSYLSSLTVSKDSRVKAPQGKTLTMTVNGVVTALKPGKSYSGTIVLSVV